MREETRMVDKLVGRVVWVGKATVFAAGLAVVAS
jgi:hypothetical protein